MFVAGGGYQKALNEQPGLPSRFEVCHDVRPERIEKNTFMRFLRLRWGRGINALDILVMRKNIRTWQYTTFLKWSSSDKEGQRINDKPTVK